MTQTYRNLKYTFYIMNIAKHLSLGQFFALPGSKSITSFYVIIELNLFCIFMKFHYVNKKLYRENYFILLEMDFLLFIITN